MSGRRDVASRLAARGEKNARDRSPAAFHGRQLDFGAMALRDLAHDREPQAAAFRAGAEHPVEALEDARALCFRNARAVVLDGERPVLPRSRLRAPSPVRPAACSASRCRAGCSAFRAAGKDRLRRRRAVSRRRSRDRRCARSRAAPSRSSLRARARPGRCARAACTRPAGGSARASDRSWLTRCVACSVALRSCRNVPCASPAGRLSQRELGLGLESGDRRAQLMRRVGDETLLRRERATQALEQLVHRS